MANSIRGKTIFVDTDGVVFIGRARVIAASVAAGSDAATLILYDALTASGQQMEKIGQVAANAFDGKAGLKKDFKTAVYADITGTAATALIELE